MALPNENRENVIIGPTEPIVSPVINRGLSRLITRLKSHQQSICWSSWLILSLNTLWAMMLNWAHGWGWWWGWTIQHKWYGGKGDNKQNGIDGKRQIESQNANITRLKSHQQSKCEVTWWLLLWFTLATWWFLVTCLCIILSDTHMGVIDKSQKLTKVQWYQAEKSSTLKVRSDWVTFVMGFISVWPKNGRQHWVRAGATTPFWSH